MRDELPYVNEEIEAAIQIGNVNEVANQHVRIAENNVMFSGFVVKLFDFLPYRYKNVHIEKFKKIIIKRIHKRSFI